MNEKSALPPRPSGRGIPRESVKFLLFVVIINLIFFWYINEHKEQWFAKMYKNQPEIIIIEPVPQEKPELYIIKPRPVYDI